MAERVADESTQEHLAPLLTGSEARHREIQGHEERIREAIGEGAQPEVLRGDLLDVVELERAAREFYLQHAGRLHDPALASLFHRYAKQEEGHVETAQGALAALPPEPEEAPPLGQMDLDEAPPLWEGTSEPRQSPGRRA